jgi:hypothetical protein
VTAAPAKSYSAPAKSYSAPAKSSHSHGSDFFGGKMGGSSYFSNMAYQPSSRYSSRRY